MQLTFFFLVHSPRREDEEEEEEKKQNLSNRFKLNKTFPRKNGVESWPLIGSLPLWLRMASSRTSPATPTLQSFRSDTRTKSMSHKQTKRKAYTCLHPRSLVCIRLSHLVSDLLREQSSPPLLLVPKNTCFPYSAHDAGIKEKINVCQTCLQTNIFLRSEMNRSFKIVLIFRGKL